MKSPLALFILFLIVSCIPKKKEKTIQNAQNDFQKILAAYPTIDSTAQHQVLTFGTFHFDRSRDGSDVVAKEHIDISKDANQKELGAIVDLLSTFRPDKIAVEWKPTHQKTMDSLYTQYLNGNYSLEKHETFQIGFRLAKRLGHTKVYCIDNNPPFPEYINAIDDWETYADSLGHLGLWSTYDIENKRLNTFMDTIQRHLSVNAYLKMINSKKHSKRQKQLWTTGLVNVGYEGPYLGADVVARWYRRNIRLFANAKNLVTTNENLLIIYGGAHKWILDELFEATPDFQVVQFNQLQEN